MQEKWKQIAAQRAVECVTEGMILGVGTGSTVNYFIEALSQSSIAISGAVPSSVSTENLLRSYGISIVDLNDISALSLYIDGADGVDPDFRMIKGGGAALTREKIVAAAADQFICIVDAHKRMRSLASLSIPIEVIPLGREYVRRTLEAMGGKVIWREGIVTDNGNQMLDVSHLPMDDLLTLETRLDRIPGVVECGLFAHRRADMLIVGASEGTQVYHRP